MRFDRAHKQMGGVFWHFQILFLDQSGGGGKKKKPKAQNSGGDGNVALKNTPQAKKPIVDEATQKQITFISRVS